MKTTLIPIQSLPDSYRAQIKNLFDGFANNRDYKISLEVETQNPTNGQGMILTQENNFYVSYQNLIVKIKPVVTEIDELSVEQVDWANLIANPGSILANYNFVDNFLFYSNTALNLEDGVLKYESTVLPPTFTLSLMKKIPRDYDGDIFSTIDGSYKFGYQNSSKKFYTTIQGKTVYSEVIKITDNPFYFVIVPSGVTIRQYNVYEKIRDCYSIPIKDIYNLPIAFMVQKNN